MQIVRQIYRALPETGEPAWDLIAPDFEFDASDVLPDFRIDLEEVVVSDHEHVVTAVKDGGLMKDSDADVHNSFFHVFSLRQGKVIRWSSHLDRANALEAVRNVDPK